MSHHMNFSAPFRLAVAGLVSLTLSTSASAQLRITEVMSSSGTGGTPDWFEVTNYGSFPVSMTGFRMDDNSFSFANSVELFGVSSIASGDSAVFVESALGAAIPDFRTFWGGSALAAAIGYYSGSGVGFGSGGDGVVVFNSTGVEQTPQTSFGAATAGSSFYWAYDPTGGFVLGSQSNGVLSTPGTITGSSFDQVTFLSATALPQNTGSVGTAAVSVPEPATLGLAAAGLALAGSAIGRRHD
jgi:hypothetical protein